VIPHRRFLNLPRNFWSNVRTISEQIGYTARGTKQIKVPTIPEIKTAFEKLGLSTAHLFSPGERPATMGETLEAYFEYRAHMLNSFVEPRLMDAAQAQREFKKLRKQLGPTCPLPMNKQSGAKKTPAYLTCIVNMLIEANAEGLPCDCDPRRLTTVTSEAGPLRTLARRVDGAFPSATNPIAIWEIKEYYYTTTFGSRVADGVYETLLDGMELEELREHEGVEVKHYLMVDSHYTWWECGRSYLCRILDMLHMGYVDEVLFGSEVMERLPSIVKEWVAIATKRSR
jgi:hypothetical protein